MSKRVTLSDADIELLLKALADANDGIGFSHLATRQRRNYLIAKLSNPPKETEAS